MKQELFDMLADGKLSEDEIEIINREARPLHLSAADVEVLIDEARPEHAVEHYKTLVSEIRQLGLLTDARQFESAQVGLTITSPPGVAREGLRQREAPY